MCFLKLENIEIDLVGPPKYNTRQIICLIQNSHTLSSQIDYKARFEMDIHQANSLVNYICMIRNELTLF